jgi:hypothetical protein
MAVANFYNSSKKCNEFAKVRVSRVSRVVERFEREFSSITFTTRVTSRLVPLQLGYGVSNASKLES